MSRFWHTGHVRRYHTVPMLDGGQTTAAHQWGVAVLLLELNPKPSVALLKAALLHDAGEHVVGDMPSPTKWAHPELARALEEREEDVLQQLGIQVDLPEEDQRWLEACDLLELVLHCDHQTKMGNKYAAAVRDRGIIALLENTATPGPVLENLWRGFPETCQNWRAQDIRSKRR